MTFISKLMERLSKRYSVIVRTQYHVQIAVEDGYHNIWFSNNGTIRIQPFGRMFASQVTEQQLFAKLDEYTYKSSDLAIMRDLTAFIREIDGKSGIFVDAGWKDGKAKYAVVRSFANGNMDITVRNIEAKNNVEAERKAIQKAILLYPDAGPIFSDCKPAVDQFERAVWIPRDQNKTADHLGNMRGK